MTGLMLPSIVAALLAGWLTMPATGVVRFDRNGVGTIDCGFTAAGFRRWVRSWRWSPYIGVVLLMVLCILLASAIGTHHGILTAIVVPAGVDRFAAGDKPGHEFHGNQYTRSSRQRAYAASKRAANVDNSQHATDAVGHAKRALWSENPMARVSAHSQAINSHNQAIYAAKGHDAVTKAHLSAIDAHSEAIRRIAGEDRSDGPASSDYPAELPRYHAGDVRGVGSRRYMEISQAERDKVDAKDFAGPHQSFPIRDQKDLNNAARLIGHADDPDAVKAKIKAIAKRKGLTLPEAWRNAEDGDDDDDDDDDDDFDIEDITGLEDAGHAFHGNQYTVTRQFRKGAIHVDATVSNHSTEDEARTHAKEQAKKTGDTHTVNKMGTTERTKKLATYPGDTLGSLTDEHIAANEKAAKKLRRSAEDGEDFDTDFREIAALSASVKAKRVMHDGREHYETPVIALREGVIRAVNAPSKEFVPRAALAAAAQSFVGAPLVIGHPTDTNGRQVTAQDARVLAARGFGIVKSATMHVDGERMLFTALADPARLRALKREDVLQRIEDGEPIEVSIGAANVRLSRQAGRYKGIDYLASWDSFHGDHLAFLPDGQGACSLEMGCGACRAAAAYAGPMPDKSQVEEEMGECPDCGEELDDNGNCPDCGYEAPAPPKGKRMAAGDKPGHQFRGNQYQQHATAEGLHQDAARLTDNAARSEKISDANKAEKASKKALAASEATGHEDAINQARNAYEAVSNGNLDAATDYHREARDYHTVAAIQAKRGKRMAADFNNDGEPMTKEQRQKMIEGIRACGCYTKPEDAAKLEAMTDDQLTDTATEQLTKAQETNRALAADKTALETEKKALADKALPDAELTQLRALAAERKAADEAEAATLVVALSALKVEGMDEAALKTKNLSELRNLAAFAKVKTAKDEVKTDFSPMGIPGQRRAAAAGRSFDAPDPYKAGIDQMRAGK